MGACASTMLNLDAVRVSSHLVGTICHIKCIMYKKEAKKREMPAHSIFGLEKLKFQVSSSFGLSKILLNNFFSFRPLGSG